MKLPYQFLTDLSKMGGVLEDGDLDPRISAQLAGAVSIPQPLRDFTGAIPANPTLNTSGIIGVGGNIGASTGATTTAVMSLGVGLWRLLISFSEASDFTTPSPVLAIGSYALTITSPGGVILALMRRWPQALTNETADFQIDFLLTEAPWAIVFNQPSTGVAQTYSWFVRIVALRLL